MGLVLGQDLTSCLRRLFKYPPVEDVHLFVERAIALKSKIASSMSASNPLVSDVSDNSTNFVSSDTSNRPGSSHAHQVLTHSSFNDLIDAIQRQINVWEPFTSTMKSFLPMGEDQLKKEVQILRNTQTHMAIRLERIVYNLSRELVEKYVDNSIVDAFYLLLRSPEAETVVNDAILVAIAELKQVKDILNGLLPMETASYEKLPPLSETSPSTHAPAKLLDVDAQSQNTSFSVPATPTVNSPAPSFSIVHSSSSESSMPVFRTIADSLNMIKQKKPEPNEEDGIQLQSTDPLGANFTIS